MIASVNKTADITVAAVIVAVAISIGIAFAKRSLQPLDRVLAFMATWVGNRNSLVWGILLLAAVAHWTIALA